MFGYTDGTGCHAEIHVVWDVHNLQSLGWRTGIFRFCQFSWGTSVLSSRLSLWSSVSQFLRNLQGAWVCTRSFNSPWNDRIDECSKLVSIQWVSYDISVWFLNQFFSAWMWRIVWYQVTFLGEILCEIQEIGFEHCWPSLTVCGYTDGTGCYTNSCTVRCA